MRLPSRIDQSFDPPESTLDKLANVLMIGLLVALLVSIAAGLMLF